MSKDNSVAKPEGYDKSFAWLNAKEAGHNPEKRSLDAMGSQVSKNAWPGAFNGSTMRQTKGNSEWKKETNALPFNSRISDGAWKTNVPTDPQRDVPLPLGRTPADFETKQIPNTSPKYSQKDNFRVIDSKIISDTKTRIYQKKTMV